MRGLEYEVRLETGDVDRFSGSMSIGLANPQVKWHSNGKSMNIIYLESRNKM